MDYRIEDIIDIPLFQTLLDSMDQIMPFPSAIINNDGKVLTATNWQDICTKFHRINPKSIEECIISDKYIDPISMRQTRPSFMNVLTVWWTPLRR